MKNIKYYECVFRVAVGIGLLGLCIFLDGRWRWAGLIGLVPLLTGIIGWCPVYALSIRDRNSYSV